MKAQTRNEILMAVHRNRRADTCATPGPSQAGRLLAPEELGVRQTARRSAPMPLVILLEDIRSLHNVGAFFRTADGAGVECLVLCGITPTPPRSEISKVALGAEENMPWRHHADSVVAAREWRERGYRIIAVEQTTRSRDLYEGPLAFPCVLVFGAEAEGLSPALLAECDESIEVPMFGAKESLNASVCAGAVLFEARRQWNQRASAGEIIGAAGPD